MPDDQHKHHGEDEKSHQKDNRYPRIDFYTHDERNDHHERRPYCNADNHHERVLHVCDIRCHSGHKAGRRILVDVGERERLDILVHRLPQIRRESGRSVRGEGAGHDAEEQTGESHEQHDQTEMQHFVYAAALDSLVDQRSCNVWDQDLHHDFQKCEYRCQQCRLFILTDLSHENFENMHKIPP